MGWYAMLDIVMTTFNSARFVGLQVDSIVNQAELPWNLYISDDASTDGTREIVRDYSRKFSEKIFDVSPERPFRDVNAHIQYVASHTRSPYVMFADHDDIWLPGKISLLVNRIKVMEQIYGTQTPCLAHSDLSVVDNELKVMDNSFWHYESVRPTPHRVERLLFQNSVTGCATIVNRSLLEKSMPFPQNIIMYDWWLGLVAAAMGQIESISTPTVLYRQHHHNTMGARRVQGLSYYKGGDKTLLNWSLAKALVYGRLSATQVQAEALLSTFNADLSARVRDALDAYVHLAELPWTRRRWTAIHYGYFTGSLQNILAMLLIL